MNTWSLTLQDSNSPSCDMMMFFHDFTMMILILITSIIMYIILSMMYNKLINRKLLQEHTLEILWTIIPMLILIIIAIPSIKILYFIDESNQNFISMKCIAHQWYWKYEYTDFFNVEFSSFMIPTNQLKLNEFRLLDVDNRCILPFNFSIRIIATSMDVIHAWAIPSLGIKMDATPGRLNQSMITMNRPGLYFGQCSEICGINHSFMPIIIESTNIKNFKNWLMTNFYIK